MNNKVRKKCWFGIILSIIVVLNSLIIIPILKKLIFGDDEDLLILIIFQILGYLIPILFILNLFKKNNDDFMRIPLNKQISVKEIFIWIFFSIIIFVIVKFLSIAITDFAFFNTEDLTILIDRTDFDFFNFIKMLIAYALLPAIIEELLYRVLLYKCGFNRIASVILSIVPFAFMHYPLVNAISALVFSLLLVLIKEKNDNYLMLVGIHFFYNMVGIIFSNYIIIPFESIAYVGDLNNFSVLICCFWSLIIAIVGSFVFVISYAFFESKKEEIHSEKEKICVFEYISFIVIILLFLFEFIINIWL